MSEADIKQTVKQKYAEAALRMASGGSACCGGSAATECCDPITSNLYSAPESSEPRCIAL